MQYLTIWDLILTPIYLFILSYLAKRQRAKKYPIGHPLRKYYLPGLYLKFGGAIFIALIYQFYYGGGDTFNFYYHSTVINSSLNDSFITWLKLLFNVPEYSDPKLYPYVSQMFWYHDPTAYTISVIGAVLGLLNATSYLPIALLFAYISFSGIWAMFRTFYNIYPYLHKQLAIAFLYIPSTFVWGSAMFKDTVCMFGLGWMTYCTFRIFLNRDFTFKNIVMLIISFFLIAKLKLYILLAFLPALSLWLLLMYSHKIKSIALRWMINILLVGISIGAFFFFTNIFASQLDRYSLEKIAKTAEHTRNWINYVSEQQEGSTYDLGEMDGVMGMLSKFPQGIVVTLFRPFLWEIKKPIMVLSALESLAFLSFTLYLFYRLGVFKFFKKIFSDPNLVFFFIFSMIFAFAVGISTGNFGTLSRYKIPCMPFFAAMLLILYAQLPEQVKKIRNNARKRKQVRHFSRL